MENNRSHINHRRNVIIKVEPFSIAAEMGVEPGDILIAINDMEIRDVFDYRYMIKDENIYVLIEKYYGEEWILEIEKEYHEDIGLLFENGMMDNARRCCNKCIFCFIDQLPKNMRETLYFKDDDSRLSFLQGNYVTLTNISEKELDRIVFYHLSPINISVHTTDPDLRKFMLGSHRAANLKQRLDKIARGGIEMNFQIVLCKGINDREQLDKTISDLSAYIPPAKSLSVVPVGLTKYRTGLHRLKPFTKRDSLKVIKQIEKWQDIFKKKYKTNFVYAADEFFLKAELPLPSKDYYQDYPQIENGVGMMTSFRDECTAALNKLRIVRHAGHVSVVTGVAASALITEICGEIKNKFNLEIDVHVVKNRFFGENITVSGLLTGQDIISALKGKKLGRKLIIPQNALKHDEDIFLDNITLSQMEEELNVPIEAVGLTGESFFKCLFSK